MNMVELNHIEEFLDRSEDCTTATSADHLLSLGSPDTDDIYGDQSISPRVGDQYQVGIPALLTEYERLQLLNSPFNTNGMLADGFSFGVGLAIPIMWFQHLGDHIKHEQEFQATLVGTDIAVPMGSTSSKEILVGSKCVSLNQYPHVSSSIHNKLPQPLEHGEEYTGSRSQENLRVMDMGLPYLQVKSAEGYIPLPGSPAISWSDAEIQSFLLGLYIFGKNLVQVKEFMGSKEMGDILSFYYGKFYRSDPHHKWSECRKLRGRKSIHGQRMFTGWRLQELLSRMFPHILKEPQDKLQEAAKSFTEGRASLVEFVFTLKAMVGMEHLVGAVGIGKGKHDLTATVVDPARSSQVVPSRPEIPVGKACSFLTSGDIIKFLTGDFRLSKAKSNDLFWEAVWPRLLARGWHSEQPKDFTSIGSKTPLVFLIPGVKKFSRKKLTRGDHYYDSVSDVLSKVASDPMLLELEVGGVKDEPEWDADTKLDGNDLSENQRHSYLRPRLPNSNSEFVKFTVVDTSLVQGEAPFKVRELRSLPMNVIYNFSPSNHLMERNSNNLDNFTDSDASSNDQGKSNPVVSDDSKLGNNSKCSLGRGMQSGPYNHLISDSKRRLVIDGNDSKDQCYDILTDKKPEKDTKYKYRRRVLSSQPKYLSPVAKRQRLIACKYEGTGRGSRGRRLKKGDPHCEKERVAVEPSQEKMVVSSVANGLVDDSSECNSSANCFDISAVSQSVISQEKTHAYALIDLNLPQFPPDFDTARPLCDGSRGALNLNGPSSPSETKYQLDEASNEVLSSQQPTSNARRQSTRNRPPTTRALEALACGFLSTKRKERNTKVPTSELAFRPTRRTRRTARGSVSDPTTNFSIASSTIALPVVGLSEEYDSIASHPSMYSDPHIPSEENEGLDSIGTLYCSETLD